MSFGKSLQLARQRFVKSPQLARPRLVLNQSAPLRYTVLALNYVIGGLPVGLPIALTGWLAERGVAPATIASMLAIIGLPWLVKLVAGPMMDRFVYTRMGLRRPWLMLSLLILCLASFSLLAIIDAVQQLPLLTTCFFAINLSVALVDVATDGMAIDILRPTERGRANAFMALGNTLGLAVGAIGGAWILNRWGVAPLAYLLLPLIALCLTLVTATVERSGQARLPWSKYTAFKTDTPRSRKLLPLLVATLRALAAPALLWFGLFLLIKGSTQGMVSALAPIMAVQHLSYDNETFTLFFATVMLVGSGIGVLGGFLVDRFGSDRVLALSLTLSAAAAFAFAASQAWWVSTAWLVLVSVTATFAGILFAVAFSATGMALCTRGIATTQFALLMAVSNTSNSLGAALYAAIAHWSYSEILLLLGSINVLALLIIRGFAAAARADQPTLTAPTAHSAPIEQLATG